MELDFYKGENITMDSFVRLPRWTFDEPELMFLDVEAKLIYAMMLDRMSLSTENGWYDEKGRIYIYFTQQEIQRILSCGHNKAARILSQLDDVKGVGLIHRERQGQGKPSRIYAKKFMEKDFDTFEERLAYSLERYRKRVDLIEQKRKSAQPKRGSLDIPKRDTN